MLSLDEIYRMMQAYRAGPYDPSSGAAAPSEVSFDDLAEFVEFVSPTLSPEEQLIADEEASLFDLNNYIL